jgi:deoxyribose-phosphate aldolase
MNVASYIDHTILKPTTTPGDVNQVCSEALTYKFAAVCIPPPFVKAARQFLEGSEVKVATVIGFPFGYSTTAAKLAEVIQALEDDADELDIVINISSLKSGFWNELELEMKQLIAPVHQNGKLVKVIIESGVLTDEEIIKCCHLYAKLGADFVKTSTGYAETGAKLEVVQLMRASLPSHIRIKASGGIRTFEAAKMYIEAGADRIGCSAGVSIIKQQSADQWANY